MGTLDEKDKKNTLNEVRILASLKHSHVVSIKIFTKATETHFSTRKPENSV